MNIARDLQRRYGAVTLMSSVLGLATIWLAPFGLINFSDNEWAWSTALATLLLGVFCTGLAFWIMAALIGSVGSVRASVIGYLIPVVSLALGVLVRSDEVAALALVGAAITTAGAYLASRPG